MTMKQQYNKKLLQYLPIGTLVTIHNSEDNNRIPFNAIIQLSNAKYEYDLINMKVVHPTEHTSIDHNRFKDHQQHSLNYDEYATILIDPSINNLPNDLFEV